MFKPRKGNSGGRFRAADGDLSSQDIEVLPNFGVTDDDAQGSLQEDEIKEMLLFAVPALGAFSGSVFKIAAGYMVGAAGSVRGLLTRACKRCRVHISTVL